LIVILVVLNLLSCAGACAAAFSWFRAGSAYVTSEEAHRREIERAAASDGYQSASIGIDGQNLAETLILQAQ
jgi:hypothetical protein